MTKRQFKPSELIMDDARTIYERKNGKPLLSYQTPTYECILQGILNYQEKSNPFVEISLPELPTINLDDERDDQPQYKKK